MENQFDFSRAKLFSDNRTEDLQAAATAYVLPSRQNNEIKAGIQVKPDSFYHMNLPYVQKLHDELDYPVHHLIYDAEGEWTNYLATISNFL